MLRLVWLLSLILFISPAWGAMEQDFRAIAAPATATTHTVSGLAFAPKALIAWTAGKTADGFTAGAKGSRGFASGTAAANQRSTGWVITDNVAVTSVSQAYQNALLDIPTTTEVTQFRVLVSQMNADGYQLNFTTTISGAIVHVLAVGGSDVTNAIVKEFTYGTTATGNLAYTGVGFQGAFVVLFGISDTTTAGAMPTAVGYFEHMAPFVGAATSSTARWAGSWTGREGQSTTGEVRAFETQVTASVLKGMRTATNLVSIQGDFVSFDSDGFTINWTDAPDSSTGVFAALVLKGGSYAVGAFNKPTGAATVTNDVTAPGFQPVAVLMESWGRVASASITAGIQHSTGGSNGTTEGAIWSGYKDATLNTQVDGALSQTKALVTSTPGATPASEAECDLSMLSTGFQCSWAVNDAVADEVLYVAVGSNPGGTPTRGLLGVGASLR